MEHTHDSLIDLEARRRRPTDRSEPGPDAAVGLGNRAAAAVLGGRVQRVALGTQGAGPLDPEIGSEIAAARGGGRPLDDATRADMEGNLDVDLSAVRIHDDSHGDVLSRSVQAEAFTTGTDVFFKSGKYQPSSSDGRRLLAHELTHVVQQSSGLTHGAGTVSHPDDPHEVEARAVGDAVASSSPVAREAEDDEELQASADPDVSVAREAEDEEELQASADPDVSVAREAEDEEELQASADPDASQAEDLSAMGMET